MDGVLCYQLEVFKSRIGEHDVLGSIVQDAVSVSGSVHLYLVTFLGRGLCLMNVQSGKIIHWFQIPSDCQLASRIAGGGLEYLSPSTSMLFHLDPLRSRPLSHSRLKIGLENGTSVGGHSPVLLYHLGPDRFGFCSRESEIAVIGSGGSGGLAIIKIPRGRCIFDIFHFGSEELYVILAPDGGDMMTILALEIKCG